jgi:hypothetical protein
MAQVFRVLVRDAGESGHGLDIRVQAVKSIYAATLALAPVGTSATVLRICEAMA